MSWRTWLPVAGLVTWFWLCPTLLLRAFRARGKEERRLWESTRPYQREKLKDEWRAKAGG